MLNDGMVVETLDEVKPSSATDAPKRGRKRRTPETGTALPMPNEKKRAIASDANQSKPDDAFPSSAQSPGPGNGSSTAINSLTKKKSTLSFNSADVLFAILTELQKYGVDAVSLDSYLFQLEVVVTSESEKTSMSLLSLLWSLLHQKSDIEQDIPDLSVHMGRTASIVAVDYLKGLQESSKQFDQLFSSARKESNERYRKRWDLLCSAKTSTYGSAGKKLALTDVPVFMDRIPNPFGSAGGDYHTWRWLTRDSTNLSQDSYSIVNDVIVQHNSEDEKSDVSNNRLFLCDEKTLQQRALRQRNRLFSSDYPLIKYFRQCMLRGISVLSSQLNAVIVDKPCQDRTSEGENIESEEVEEEEVMHRALLIGSLIATYCGQPKPDVDPRVASEIRRFRKIAATESADVWGPILLVCKMADMAAWEAGLAAVVREFQLEILPYYGSDNDRMSLRSYLRALSTVGGMYPIGSGFYSERSHCHIILISYETLLLDLHYFKEVLWFLMIFDESWGFFSNSKYVSLFPPMMELLRSRHKVFASSALSTPSTPSKDHTLQLPDIFSIAPILSPYFVGIPSIEELTKTVSANLTTTQPHSVPPNHPNHTNHVSAALHATLKQFLDKKASLFVSNGSDVIDVDDKGAFYLNALFAAMTIVFDEKLFLSLEKSVSREGGVTSTASTSLINDCLNLTSLLIWNGAEIQVRERGSVEGGSGIRKCFKLDSTSPFLPTSFKPLFNGKEETEEDEAEAEEVEEGHERRNQKKGEGGSEGSEDDVEVVVVSYDVERRSDYYDVDIDFELQQVIFSAVGKTGLNLQRLAIEPPSAAVTSEPSQSLTAGLVIGASRNNTSDHVATMPMTMSGLDLFAAGNGGMLMSVSGSDMAGGSIEQGGGRGRGRGRGGRGAGRAVGVGRGRGRGRGEYSDVILFCDGLTWIICRERTRSSS